MARRKRPSEAKTKAADQPFHSPFGKLRKVLRRSERARSSAAAPERPLPVLSADDDEVAFSEAMTGVVPLSADERARVDGPAPAGPGAPRPVSEDAEALAALSDLVSGEAAFDITDTDEYIEGHVAGLDPRLVRRLRNGDFAWQAHLDLHRQIVQEARASVETFLTAAIRKGHRCVLIIHGRGRNSKDQIPVLKERLKVWLARGALARHVLAFATARPCDGGAGAMVVLLRRERRRRAPFVVTNGAKR